MDAADIIAQLVRERDAAWQAGRAAAKRAVTDLMGEYARSQRALAVLAAAVVDIEALQPPQKVNT